MLREFYFGKINPFERGNRKAAEQLEIVHKIDAEERYFASKMSAEDCQRFKELSNLYSELAESGESELFAYGYSLGALTMIDVMNEAKFIIHRRRPFDRPEDTVE